MISLKKVLLKLSYSVTPVGAITAYYGTTPPANWLVCDGSTFDTSKYPKLYELLGTNTLPDLRDKFIVGSGSSYALNATGGEATHTLTVDEMPNHSHPVYSRRKYATGTIEAMCGWNEGGLTQNTNSTGGNQPHNNLPPYTALTYIICGGGAA